MKFRSMVLGLAAVLISLSAFNANAQNTYDRLSIIEEFTSATCPPCVPASETLNSFVEPANGVVSVRFHMDWPRPNDPWNLDNPSENQARRAYYAVSGIPYGRLNGAVASMTNRAALESAIAAANAQKAPVGFEITQGLTQTGGNVTVKVMSNVALTNHVLYVAVVSRYAHLPNLPSQLTGSNGETEFYDAMNKMLPNAAGTNLNIAANGEMTYNFTYTKKGADTWPAGQQYIVAYIQEKASNQVINAGTNLVIVKARAEVASDTWQKIDKAASSSTTVRLYNDTDEDMDVDLAIANAANLSQAGWTVNLGSPFAKIPANGSVEVPVSVMAPSSSSFAGIQLDITPVAPGKITQDASVVFGYLTNGARGVVYYQNDGGEAVSAVTALASTYGADIVYVPYTTETNAAYPITDFDVAIMPVGFNGRFNIVNYIPAIQAMQAAKKGVWLHAPIGLAVALNDQNQQFPGYPAAKAWFASIGLTQFQTVARNNGQTYTSFPVTGVSGTPIGNAWSSVANQATQQWPFAMASNDIILNPGTGAKSFVYADNNQNNISGVYWTDGNSKVVYSTFGPEHISNQAHRNTLTQNVLDWLFSTDAGGGAEITVDASLLNFGEVPVGEDKEMSFMITNSGDKDLVLNSIELSGGDAIAFDITAGRISSSPVTVAPQGTHKVTVSFAPGSAKANFTSSVVINGNAPANPIQLRGSATLVSVETESVSETGSIVMSLVGQNPVTDRSAIALTATLPTTVNVVDVNGSVVATLFSGTTEGAQNLDINASTLASGTYTVVATNGSERAALTIVVAK